MTKPHQAGDVESLSAEFRRRASARSQHETRLEGLPSVGPQQGIQWGTPWMAWVDGSDGYSRHVHVRWGRVLTYQEALRGRLYAGESPEELRDHAGALLARYDRGWRLSITYCACSPEEPSVASFHRNELWPITWVEYGYAEQAGFDPKMYRRSGWFRAMTRRVKTEQEMALGNEGLEEL